MTERFGSRSQETGTIHNEIGWVLDDKGDYDGALVQYEKARAIWESVRGRNHPDTAASCHNIGLVLEKKGNYDGALVQYNKALAIQESVLGKNHPSTAFTYNKIGFVLEQQQSTMVLWFSCPVDLTPPRS